MGSQPAPTDSGQREIAVTSVKIEQTQLDAFKIVAAANRRSVSQQLRWLIDRDIEAFRSQQAQEPVAA